MCRVYEENGQNEAVLYWYEWKNKTDMNAKVCLCVWEHHKYVIENSLIKCCVFKFA